MNSIEKVWDELLSRNSSTIQITFQKLSADEKKTILDHLMRMASEPGWHIEQKISAQAAIHAINQK